MPSFDILCEMDRHELANAVDQANREIGNRFDFKGVSASFELKESEIILKAEVDFQLNQMMDILRNKMTKRGVDVGHLKAGEPVLLHKKAEQVVTLQQGLSKEVCKNIVKYIKNKKLKVQSTVQGEQIRVTGKKRDDLQEVISLIKEENFGVPIQFGNYRD